jgi:hypothetical protein
MKRCLFGVFILSLSTFSFGVDKYCAAKGNSYTLHFFGSSFLADLHRRDFLRGIDALNNDLKRGDALKVVFHKPKGDYRVVLDACVPGCPETGVLESLTAECSAQIAKKDYVDFKNKYLSAVKQAGSMDKTGYNVFQDLVTLSDYYRGRGASSGKIYVFHSLVPNGLGTKPSQANYDSAFVDLVQNEKALPDSLPKLAFVNADTSKLNYEFWQDVQKLVKSGSLNFISME